MLHQLTSRWEKAARREPGAGRDCGGSQRGQSCRKEHAGGLDGGPGQETWDLCCEGGAEGQEIVNAACHLLTGAWATYLASLSLRLFISKMGSQQMLSVSCTYLLPLPLLHKMPHFLLPPLALLSLKFHSVPEPTLPPVACRKYVGLTTSRDQPKLKIGVYVPQLSPLEWETE